MTSNRALKSDFPSFFFWTLGGRHRVTACYQAQVARLGTPRLSGEWPHEAKAAGGGEGGPGLN